MQQKKGYLHKRLLEDRLCCTKHVLLITFTLIPDDIFCTLRGALVRIMRCGYVMEYPVLLCIICAIKYVSLLKQNSQCSLMLFSFVCFWRV